MTVDKQLKYYLELYGMTETQLSNKSGVSRQELSRWLSGAKPKKMTHVRAVADALMISLDTLLSDIQEERRKLYYVG